MGFCVGPWCSVDRVSGVFGLFRIGKRSVYIQGGRKNLVKVPDQKREEGAAVMSKMNRNKMFDDRGL